MVVDDAPDPRLLRHQHRARRGARVRAGQRRASLEAAGHRAARPRSSAPPISDLVNLEIALLARRLRPELRVVVQLGNEAVGRARRAGDRPGERARRRVDRGARPSPRPAWTCTAGPSRSAASPSSCARWPRRRAGTLRQLFGDLAPIAVVPADGSRDARVPRPRPAGRAGDRVVVISTAADLRDRQLLARRRTRRRAPSRPPRGAAAPLRPRRSSRRPSASCARRCGCCSGSPSCPSCCSGSATAPQTARG